MSDARAVRDASASSDPQMGTASATTEKNSGVRLRFIDTANRRMPVAIMEWRRDAPLLADLVSLYADLGLRVAHHELLPPSDHSNAPVHRFGFDTDDIDWSATTSDLVRDAFEAAASGVLEVDGFARLIAAASIPFDDAVLVRAAARYLGQVGLELSEPTVVSR